MYYIYHGVRQKLGLKIVENEPSNYKLQYTFQQAVLEAFGCLRDLQERMTGEGVCGGDEGFQQPELVVFNVADWPAEEVAQLCRDATVTPNPDGAIEFINAVVPIGNGFSFYYNFN